MTLVIEPTKYPAIGYVTEIFNDFYEHFVLIFATYRISLIIFQRSGIQFSDAAKIREICRGRFSILIIFRHFTIKSI